MSVGRIFITKILKFLTCVCIVSIMVAYIFPFNPHGKPANRLFLRRNHTVSAHVNRCTVIVHNDLGRLGNVLFQFASAYGLSLDHSCNLYLGPNILRYLLRYFEIDLPDLLTEIEFYYIPPAKQIYSHCTYFPDLFRPNTSQTIELTGYWQVQKYFVNHTDEIRHQLRFKQKILNPADTFIKTNISRNASNIVGIHIRRGDFVGMRNISSDKFIFDGMNYFIGKYHSVNFIIVSDDKPYCRKVFGKRNDTFFTPDSFGAATDMAVLTLCDHIIVTVGTYGWWGAFLLHNRTGEVITDAKPNYGPLDVNCERSDFFPDWFSFLNRTK